MQLIPAQSGLHRNHPGIGHGVESVKIAFSTRGLQDKFQNIFFSRPFAYEENGVRHFFLSARDFSLFSLFILTYEILLFHIIIYLEIKI